MLLHCKVACSVANTLLIYCKLIFALLQSRCCSVAILKSTAYASPHAADPAVQRNWNGPFNRPFRLQSHYPGRVGRRRHTLALQKAKARQPGETPASCPKAGGVLAALAGSSAGNTMHQWLYLPQRRSTGSITCRDHGHTAGCSTALWAHLQHLHRSRAGSALNEPVRSFCHVGRRFSVIDTGYAGYRRTYTSF